MKASKHKNYDPGVDLMHQDCYHMGHKLGTNVDLLFATHPSEKMKYVILVDTDTGESIKVEF